MSIPEFMPVLSAGAHSSPSEGACVMEMVSYLAGEKWSDSPACTHPMLARMAQAVNDRLPDSERHVLVPLIGRLFGTGETGTEHERKVLSVQLACWCARQVLDLSHNRPVSLAAIKAAEGWIAGEVSEDEVRAAAGVGGAAVAAYAAADAAVAAVAAAADAAAAAAVAAVAAVAAAADAAAAAAAADALVPLLTGLLDEYDRITGRTEHRDVTSDDLARLAALTH